MPREGLNDGQNKQTTTTDAIEALRARDVSDPESLVSCTSPERIIATCEWWDRQSGVRVGLLVKRIKDGGIEAVYDRPIVGSGRAQNFARFNRTVTRFPEMSVTESHKRMSLRCWQKDDCDCTGVMVVLPDPTFPVFAVRCDACGFEAGYPLKSLPVLPENPPIPPRPVPDSQPQVPEGARRPPASYPSVRGVHPVRFDERSLRWRR